MCINKCLESIVKHLPNSPAIICGMVSRDVHRERAYLWVQNCQKKNWTNSNLSAGRKFSQNAYKNKNKFIYPFYTGEYCCKSGEVVNCLKIEE